MTTFCRDCCRDLLGRLDQTEFSGRQVCPTCGGHRLITHGELAELSIAHLDCDAFYASVEKRDNPDLAGKPVIVGGGKRGVVAACCYVARISGVRSAMPMFKALKACPDAVVIRPNMDKYQRVGRQVRSLMQELTPLVEPLSIDEAFLDLTGTEALHKASPAETLMRLVKRIEKEVGITASVGLSYNKFLAKVASDLDKPKGFAVIGKADALDFLAAQPVGLIWGVGKSLQRKLEGDGVRTIADLRRVEEKELMARYGAMGGRLYAFARGQDNRRVTPGGQAKSVSSETTFDQDISDLAELEKVLWRLSEKVSRRLKKSELTGGGVTLKLKTKDFRLLTRSAQLPAPTQSSEDIFRAARPLLLKETDGRAFRLLGVGLQKIQSGRPEITFGDLADPDAKKRSELEAVMDKVRDRFGNDAVIKGRGL